MGRFHWLLAYFSGIRAKLIGIFLLIKVLPLVLLALLAWKSAEQLGASITDRSIGMADQMLATIKSVGDSVTEDATRALDDRSRESIERVTTDTARAVAAFLYDRDQDILQAARLEPEDAAYRAFQSDRQRELYTHGAWRLAADGKGWEPVEAEGIDPSLAADAKAALPDNTRDFSARPPEYLGYKKMRPLYLEMTFVGLDGRERVKVTPGARTTSTLANIRDRLQTFAKAETYWRDLQQLKSGEIYVSEVIGSYVGSRIIGPYTPQTAQKAGTTFTPEESAYAGTENPLGKRFHGIVRWATPIERDGVRLGYVTLALDHDHIRQFTDRIVPTAKRYTPISDAIAGNYAFMWDHKNRAISHPRDYFIPGYNARTGLPETPWMDQSLYESWQASGKSAEDFLSKTPAFQEQSLKKKPAAALIKAGTIGLDCRYLNFAPQCKGWNQLTENGGSGSFVIFFTGLWKLTTAATIPYYTGQYGKSPRGFGFVTIGAGIDAFHQAAMDSRAQIGSVIDEKDREFKEQRASLLDAIAGNLSHTAWQLLLSTLLMVLLVIVIAIQMANVLTRRITAIINGVHRFQGGDHGYRLKVSSRDEMGQLATSFNCMADTVQESFSAMSRELHTRRQTEEKLRIAATAFEAQVGIIVTDANGVILTINRAFSENTGYTAAELLGQNPRLLKSGRHDPAFYIAMWKSIRRTGVWQGEIWDRCKNGAIHPKWLTITAVEGEDRGVTHYVGTQIDITERKAAEDEIKNLAFYDPLTHLPNRRLLLDHLHQALAASSRNQWLGALLFIDLDNFKTLNDTLGHAQGDMLLEQVAQRLLRCMREGDTVGRLGGDEFVVMLVNVSQKVDEAAARAEMIGMKILAELNRTYTLGGKEYQTTSSIGVTMFGGAHETSDELLRQADMAMYQAKAAGRNALRFFDPRMQATVTARLSLETDLRNALRERQFVLYYQAQVDGEGHTTGAEVLVRWQHPQRGLVSPAEFIPLAEETGLILPLGQWVLETACAQLARWSIQPEMANLTVAVNVSARQFRQTDFVDQVLAVIQNTGADPQRLKLELTESLLVENVEEIIEKMCALKSKGVRFSLDDFGTGYSSLSYLKRLPLDQLKIDQSFVRDVLIDPNDAAIARTVVALAQSLGLGVIAEGVETAEQRNFLASSGCQAYQGYFFSRPVPVNVFENFSRSVLLTSDG